MLDKDISGILETFYRATQLPVFFVAPANSILIHYPDCMNDRVLTDFFDFSEILDFAGQLFSGKINSSKYPSHIVHTRNYFVYNVVVPGSGPSDGVVISGPVPSFSPDEKRIDELLLQNRLPLHRKPEMKALLSILPVVPSEHFFHYCKLLFVLCRTNNKKEILLKPKVHDNQEIPELFSSQPLSAELDTSMWEKDYLFLIKLRDIIIRGNVAMANELLYRSTNLLWDTTGNIGDISDTLRNRYSFLCSYACICSIKGKAPYTYVMNILNKTLAKANTFKRTDEIVSGMIAVIKACTQAVSAWSNNSYSLHVNRAIQYIRNHYTNNITLEKLADYLQINPIYFSSLMKKETKLSLSDNINRVRVEESCSLLAYTNKSINDIAYSVGFSYHNHFCRVFKKFTDMTPQEYRKAHRLNAE